MKYFQPRIRIKLGRFRLYIYSQTFVGFITSRKEMIHKLRSNINDLPTEEQSALSNFLVDTKES